MEFETLMPRCVFGEGSSAKLGALALEFHCHRALCIYDKGVYDAGLVRPILDTLEAAGLSCTTFDRVLPDPGTEIVDQAAGLARAERIDLVVAIGGGSAIDTAKAVNILLRNPGSIRDYFGVERVKEHGVTFIVLPTTAGTGSEMTRLSVLSDAASQRKQFVRSWKLVPTVAIVDPKLMLGLPRSITASTGVDALSHACEGFTSPKANPVTDAMCLSAVKLIFENLRVAVENGSDLQARENMAIAATQAGFGFAYSSVHVGHGLAHAMGAQWHIPHGVACALALPFALRHVCPTHDVARLRQLGAAMSITIPDGMSSPEATDILVSRICLLCAQIGLPSLRSLGIPKEQLESIVSASMQEEVLCQGGGIPLDEETCRSYYIDMFQPQEQPA